MPATSYGKAIWFLCILIFPALVFASNPLAQLQKLESSSFMISDASDLNTDQFRAQTPYVPASTTKLVTAWLALRHWGEDHRFETSFYVDTDEATLWIKGGGDPFLVSEELQIIAGKLALILPPEIRGIALDVSLYESQLTIPGAGKTNNPYDAIPTALASNFNTINLKKANGKLVSAEPQTPLTPFSRSFASEISGSSLRINTGRNPRQSERYFAELLRELIRSRGISVGDEIIWGSVPAGKPDYTHQNTKTLAEIIELMLEYSTNFIANELILTLVAEHYGKPANFSLVSDYMNSMLFDQFGWKDYNFDEGAGLSSYNRMSSRQLLELLQEFSQWFHLMPEISPDIYAKTGTLDGVQTLAGYIKTKSKNHLFAIMVNETIDVPLAKNVAIELRHQLTTVSKH